MRSLREWLGRELNRDYIKKLSERSTRPKISEFGVFSLAVLEAVYPRSESREQA